MTDNNGETHNNNTALDAWKSKREYLSAIAITDVLVAMGADANQDRDKNKWKVHGVGNIIVKPNSQAWLDGNAQLGGHGAVSLVRHCMMFSKDTEAMKWLGEQFPEYLREWSADMKMTTLDEEENNESSFTPPERHDDGIEDVKQYLHKKRNLPLSLINREIKAGRLYATRKWDGDKKEYGEAQCVFIGPSSAELRSTDVDGFKGCCEGSDSEKSSYQVMFNPPHEQVVAQTEAAVDALSYHVLHPHHFVVSTNGAGRFPYQYRLTLEAFRNGFSSKWAFDADEAGDLASQRLFNALFLRDVLAENWGVEPEKIDEWMIQGKVVSLPIQSPHLMFLHGVQEGQDTFKVLELKRTQQTQEGSKRKKMVTELVDTGQDLPPTIEVAVRKNITGTKDPVARGHVETFSLTKQQVIDILNRYLSERARPRKAKDWNEILVHAGVDKIQSYEQSFGKKKEENKDGKKAPPSQASPQNPSHKEEGLNQEKPKRGRFQRTSAS